MCFFVFRESLNLLSKYLIVIQFLFRIPFISDQSVWSTPEMADPVVLNYHDSVLRKSDLLLLEKPNWLNDNIIAFAFQYFQEVVL